ncbi:hypothetical protein CHH49_14050 [Terribacillus saccharophilus]|uniref:DUF4367 domain-containing protein n=1 Tax=Terribacillus saccharophilus TaxID=361277 RepID=UPI000BA5263D|nr:DUF4367 domain-containing protein [Terribacillus saccharophilus]PAF20656.1 hypothetical protein CHH49_14050 [Terribacillus saccharophilus]
MNKIRKELEKIEIPQELSNRVTLGITQAKSEEKKKKKPKWIILVAASILIAGAGLSFNGSQVTNAAETLLSQLFGSRENLSQTYPDEDPVKFDLMEQSLSLAQENLTDKEFADYTQLMKELVEIKHLLEKEKRDPSGEESLRLKQIKLSMSTYESKFALLEAQQLASFTVTKPTYLPEGYVQSDESFAIFNKGEDPVVSLNYRNKDSVFETQQLNINQTADIELQETGLFLQPKTYSLYGHEFEFISNEDVSGMRVTVPGNGYKIILTTYDLSKEEMEKVLLSMIEQ